MSDQTNVQTTADAKPAKKARAPRKATVPHSTAIASYAKAKQIDTTRAGKLFRARLRGAQDVYVKNGGKAHAKNAPWGDHPRKALAAIFPDVPTFKG